MHATILKGIVGDFKCTVFQRNLKESYGRPLIYVCECWRKVTKVGSTATVVRNSVLIISHITFRDCRVHFILDKLSQNNCILSTEFWPRLYALLFLFFMTFDIRDSRFDQIIRRDLKEGQQEQQCQKTVIWLAEIEKLSCCTCGMHFIVIACQMTWNFQI